MEQQQFISPDQWEAVKGTICALNGAEVEVGTEADLPGWFFELRDQLTQLVVAATRPVEPFEVSEHFLYLLDMYVAGSSMQSQIGEGSRLVIDWAQATLNSAASAGGLRPLQSSTKSLWLVIQAMDEEPGQ